MSVQDPFSEGSDPAFHSKRGPGPGCPPYQQGGGPTDPSLRMQYDANKDPYGGSRKGDDVMIFDLQQPLALYFCSSSRFLRTGSLRCF